MTKQDSDKASPVCERIRPRRAVKPPSYLKDYDTSFNR